ncbi:hypothetical protein [Roseomonas sp. CECT 9278]|uniref:hypothetical protein n=1 Tax=Roseomonas sp. CECT 9278 TaxID=2845823 RepID=UPI001E54F348|nr:hypothetical protein [Roseomonas sp. CECT 9278]CAH0134116.1 hypothetical protein ROS9278_00307 [Roseomonas sp. CECT 9278]
MTIPVDLGNGDMAALDTLTASRQGLVVVLLDGRVILVPLSWREVQEVTEAWQGGRLDDLLIRPPYVTFTRTTVH